MHARRFFLLALVILLILAVLPVADAETVTFGAFSADSEATALDLGDVIVKDYNEFCRFLDQFPNLEKVDMFATKIRAKEINVLAERYPNVEFGWTMVIVSKDHKHTVRTDATAFSTLHNNKSTKHSSSDFAILKYCKNLKALDIGHNNVKDLTFLEDLPELRLLILACNAIDDITPIASLKHLEYAELFKNNITDITPLSGLTSMLDLNICFNRIKDWTPIYSLQKLGRLWIYNSNNYSDDKPVPKDVVAGLKEALPSTYIDSTHYSTMGGWREHPHYDIIYEVFKTGVYMPFEESEPEP